MTFLNTRAPSGHRTCANLRCKEMYYTLAKLKDGGENLVVKDPAEDKHIYWCVKTARDQGPDHQWANLEGCSPERECYEG